MEPILNELSIEPVAGVSADERMLELVGTLAALRRLGAAPGLRSSRSAIDRHVDVSLSVREWLFSRHPNHKHREAKQWLRRMLDRAPFVEEIHALAEADGSRAVEVRYRDSLVHGLGVAYLLRSVAVSLFGTIEFMRSPLAVVVASLDEGGVLVTADHGVVNVWNAISVGLVREQIVTLVLATISSGEVAWARRADLFSHIDWSREAEEQLRSMRASDLLFRGVVDRLVILNQATAEWSGGPFEPPLNFSPDTGNTLKDGRVGAERNCTLESGEVRQLSLHIKLTDYWRIYFEFRQVAPTSPDSRAEGRVLVGHIGKHLRL